MKNENMIDFTNTFDNFMKDAHDYGVKMEKLYGEPMEYSTSKFEALSMSIYKLKKDIVDNNMYDLNNSYHIKISRKFIEEVKNHKCNCINDALNRLFAVFNNPVVSYV
jgi:hypothetical protein